MSREDFIAIIFIKNKKDIAGLKLSCSARTIEALDTALTICKDYNVLAINDFGAFPYVIWGSKKDKKFTEGIQEISKANIYIAIMDKKPTYRFYINGLFYVVEKDEEAEYDIGKLQGGYKFLDNYITITDLYRLIANLKDFVAKGHNAFKVGKQVWGIL